MGLPALTPCVEFMIRKCLGNLLLLSQWVRRLSPFLICHFAMYQKAEGKEELRCAFSIARSCIWHCRVWEAGLRLGEGRGAPGKAQGAIHSRVNMPLYFSCEPCLTSVPPRLAVTEPICHPSWQACCMVLGTQSCHTELLYLQPCIHQDLSQTEPSAEDRVCTPYLTQRREQTSG